MDVVDLNLFSSRIRAICGEMGVVLQRSAISTNIKDRLDYSCALFDTRGDLIAQAAHIPVHLGSMAYAMADLVASFDWQSDDCLIVNNPFLGGTHLPDVTLISPCFVDDECLGFVATRAHHANIGAEQPGSMPVSSSILDEGLIIGPAFLLRAGRFQPAVVKQLETLTTTPPASPGDWATHPDFADFFAQLSANRKGLFGLHALLQEVGVERFRASTAALNDYGRRLAKASLSVIPNGRYGFEDVMDDDGLGGDALKICLQMAVADGAMRLDFTGTSQQAKGNLNCPLPVTSAAVFYVVRALMPDSVPTCAGLFSSVQLNVPIGCLLNATWPAAVAAGNVETSMRIVDVMLGALAPVLPERIPAAAQGTMNNLAMGGRTEAGASADWDYYETIAGGLGGHAAGKGLSAVQAHMTNTLNTPVESLELHYPLRLKRYAIRKGSGGKGKHRGGDGVVREFEFLEPASVSLLTERRKQSPWGLAGGSAGSRGVNRLNGKPIAGKAAFNVKPADVLSLCTPGGGGYGKASD